MIKLILIDCDGTLVGSNGVPDSAWDAVERVQALGIPMALCTGRPAGGLALGFAKRIDPNGIHIFDAGGALVRPDGTVVRTAAMPHAGLQSAAAVAEQHGLVLELYPPDGRYLVLRETEGTAAHAKLLNTPATLVTVEDVTELEIVRAQFLVAPGATFDAARPAAQLIAGCHLHEATSPVMPGYRFCALTADSASKVAAARWLAAQFDADLSEVAAIGDGDNDRDLIAAVGLGIAMGNASEATKSAARLVVKHVDDDGLTWAMSRVADGHGWGVGDPVRLHWLNRNATPTDDPRPERIGHVVRVERESAWIRVGDGPEVEYWCANGHPAGADRKKPRWVASFRPP